MAANLILTIFVVVKLSWGTIKVSALRRCPDLSDQQEALLEAQEDGVLLVYSW